MCRIVGEWAVRIILDFYRLALADNRFLHFQAKYEFVVWLH